MQVPIYLNTPDIDLISNGIYIGNIETTKDVKFLKTHGIRAILSVTASPVAVDRKVFDHIQFKINDSPYQDIITLFDTCNSFIDSYVSKKVPILVHCDMGKSRSVSIVIAYLMKKNGAGFNEIYGFVKTKRHTAEPNIGFVYQLKLYEKMGYTLSGGSGAHKLFNNFVVVDKKNQDFSFDTERYIDFINKQAQSETGGKAPFRGRSTVPKKMESFMYY